RLDAVRGYRRKSGRCGCRQRDERVPSAWRSSVPSQQPSRNDDLLDLAGALIKSKDANVAVESLDAVVGDIPGTAENLHGLVGDAPNHLRRKILGAGGFHRDALSRIALSRGIEHHAFRGVGFGLAVGQDALDQLEFGDLLAELLAFSRIGHA